MDYMIRNETNQKLADCPMPRCKQKLADENNLQGKDE